MGFIAVFGIEVERKRGTQFYWLPFLKSDIRYLKSDPSTMLFPSVMSSPDSWGRFAQDRLFEVL